MTLQRVFASEHLYRDWCDKCQYALKPALTDGSARTLTQYSQPAHAAAHACSAAMGEFAVAVAPFLTASGR